MKARLSHFAMSYLFALAVVTAVVTALSPVAAHADEASRALDVKLKIRGGATATVVEHGFQFGATTIGCDSVLTLQQCFDFIAEIAEPTVSRFTTISLQSWPEALKDINAVIDQDTAEENVEIRKRAMRSLAIQARHTVNKLTQASLTPPPAIANLNAAQGITRVEIVHRLLITRDSMLVDHMFIDRTSSDAKQHHLIGKSAAMKIEDTSEPFRQNIEAAMASTTIRDAK